MDAYPVVFEGGGGKISTLSRPPQEHSAPGKLMDVLACMVVYDLVKYLDVLWLSSIWMFCGE